MPRNNAAQGSQGSTSQPTRTVQQPLKTAGVCEGPSNQRGCWVNQRAVDVSPGIECMGTDDGATQKATQGVKNLEAHKTRWVLSPARAKKTVATPGRDKFRAD